MEAVNSVVDFIGFNTSTFLIFISVFIIAYKLSKKQQNLPPGPRPWPFIGNIPELAGNPTKALLRLKREYGDVITLYIGSRPSVFLLSHDVIKEALVRNSQALSGRPQHHYYMRELTGQHGISSTKGQLWWEQQRFAVGYLKEAGMGKSEMEARIQDEALCFIDELLKHRGQPVDPAHCIQYAIANIINTLMFGHRFDYDDSFFRSQLEKLDTIVELIGGDNPLNLAPWLKYLPGDLFRHKELKRIWKEYISYYERESSSKLMSHVDGVVQDFSDAYVAQIKKNEGKKSSNFNVEQMVGSLFDLMGGGSETAVNVIRWGIAHLLHHPDVMSRITTEIDEVIGREHFPSNHDRARMPYTEAVILETMRIQVVAPLAIPHETTEKLQLRGFSIPAHTEVIVALGASMNDPAYWEKPEVFNPERFLNKDGKLVDADRITVFSMGKRACPGEALARMELFIFFVMLLQRVHLSNPPGCPLPDLEPIIGLTAKAPPYEVVVSQRED